MASRFQPPVFEPLRSHAASRLNFMEEAIRNDRFLRRLPLAGAEVGGVGPFEWDRLQWFIAGADPRPLIEAMPWSEIAVVELLGGASHFSALPPLLVAEARRRGIFVRGHVVGPVTGRWAPSWIFGAQALAVATPDLAQELEDLGLDATISVDAGLLPREMAALATLGGDSTWKLDIHASSSRALVRDALEHFLPRTSGAIREILAPVPGELLPLFEEMFAPKIAGVSMRFLAGDVLSHSEPHPVLSCAPYRALCAGLHEGSAGVGVLEDEVCALSGSVPDWLEPYCLPESRKAAP